MQSGLHSFPWLLWGFTGSAVFALPLSPSLSAVTKAVSKATKSLTQPSPRPLKTHPSNHYPLALLEPSQCWIKREARWKRLKILIQANCGLHFKHHTLVGPYCVNIVIKSFSACPQCNGALCFPFKNLQPASLTISRERGFWVRELTTLIDFVSCSCWWVTLLLIMTRPSQLMSFSVGLLISSKKHQW